MKPRLLGVLILLMLSRSNPLGAATIEVSVRYVEVDVATQSKEVEEFKRGDNKLKVAGEGAKRSAEALEFLDSLDDLPVNHEIEDSVTLGKNLTAKSKRESKNPANELSLSIDCKPLEKVEGGIRIEVQFKADSERQRYRRGVTLDFTPTEMEGKRCRLLAIEKQREGEPAFHSATFCVVEFKKAKAE